MWPAFLRLFESDPMPAQNEPKQSLSLAIFEKWFVPVVIFATCGLMGAAGTSYLAVRDLTALTAIQGSQIKALQSDFQEYRKSSVTRDDLLVTMTRIEQNTEMMLLRSGIRPPSK